jgi:hypothetical protein
MTLPWTATKGDEHETVNVDVAGFELPTSDTKMPALS